MIYSSRDRDSGLGRSQPQPLVPSPHSRHNQPMPLVSTADQEHLRESFADLKRPVRLLFFTQALGCETCLEARQILDELPPLSDKITIDEVNFVLDGDRVAQYGIDRVPAIAVAYEEEGSVKDSRIRFLGTPADTSSSRSCRRSCWSAGPGRSFPPITAQRSRQWAIRSSCACSRHRRDRTAPGP